MMWCDLEIIWILVYTFERWANACLCMHVCVARLHADHSIRRCGYGFHFIQGSPYFGDRLVHGTHTTMTVHWIYVYLSTTLRIEHSVAVNTVWRPRKRAGAWTGMQSWIWCVHLVRWKRLSSSSSVGFDLWHASARIETAMGYVRLRWHFGEHRRVLVFVFRVRVYVDRTQQYAYWWT